MSAQRLTLSVAQRLIESALTRATSDGLRPIAVSVLDDRGCPKATAAQDGVSLLRSDIAHGKAFGALAMGVGSRALFERAQQQSYFIEAVNTLAHGRLVPVPGGVLISSHGTLLGAIGISGDTSDRDETCAAHAVGEVGLDALLG